MSAAADPTRPLRPRELALLLLASAGSRPRQRARDQQADQVGLRLKRRILDQLVILDPAPEQFEAALAEIVDELGTPSGPVRAIAAVVRDEWQTSLAVPQFVEHLLAGALEVRKPRSRRA